MALTKASAKKNKQLGKAFGTASHQLRTDILFAFVAAQGAICYRCGKKMTRKTFSIDHKDDWMDSDDPIGLFFDLENISFSHRTCNYSAARRPNRRTDEEIAEMSPQRRNDLLRKREKAKK